MNTTMTHDSTIAQPRVATNVPAEIIPGAGLDAAKMPGHWLLARMGKRVLRPGGLAMTTAMLAALAISADDEVVEFAPGMGLTTKIALAKQPATYTAVEADAQAALRVQAIIGEDHCCQLGTAQQSGLDDESATVLFGEAFLTMQSDEKKQRIIDEAFRILKPGGRYGVHEMAIVPDEAPSERQEEVRSSLTRSIHVGARPVSVGAWKAMLESAGFEIVRETRAPMALLRPARVLRDEGLIRSLKFVFNIVRSPAALRRVKEMRRVFNDHANDITAISFVARKPG